MAHGGVHCPYCQSRELSAGRPVVDGATITQGVVCGSCQREWHDVFRLAGFVGASTLPPPVGEATTDPAPDAAWQPCTLRFARTERLTVTTQAQLDLLTRTRCSDAEVLASLRDAVTAWVMETDAGKGLWLYAQEDLNIGDLLGADAFLDAELVTRMESHGLRFVSGSGSDEGRCFAYDSVLVDVNTLLGAEAEALEPDETLESIEP
ncbi:MAG: hypothetical protein BGP25_05275 [Lysobacterales bacterium 63-13]|nr:MAG: hypothetical protein BGP25_05275 [Xanthomonadales bacterium 63-13]